MGDNGAGKSTLVKIIAGNFPPSSGTMLLDGQDVTFHSPLDARQHGIEIVYQDLALCDNLTAALNVFMGRELIRGIGPFKFLDRRAMVRRAGELFAELKSETRPEDLVQQMSGGQRQAVAIARTRLSDPKIVLMDEPTASISVRQVAEVLDMIRHLKETNHAVILISHRMPDVFAVSRSGGGAAPRQQGGRQADRRDHARGRDRPHHRRHRAPGLTAPWAGPPCATAGGASSASDRLPGPKCLSMTRSWMELRLTTVTPARAASSETKSSSFESSPKRMAVADSTSCAPDRAVSLDHDEAVGVRIRDGHRRARSNAELLGAGRETEVDDPALDAPDRPTHVTNAVS